MFLCLSSQFLWLFLDLLQLCVSLCGSDTSIFIGVSLEASGLLLLWINLHLRWTASTLTSLLLLSGVSVAVRTQDLSASTSSCIPAGAGGAAAAKLSVQPSALRDIKPSSRREGLHQPCLEHGFKSDINMSYQNFFLTSRVFFGLDVSCLLIYSCSGSWGEEDRRLDLCFLLWWCKNNFIPPSWPTSTWRACVCMCFILAWCQSTSGRFSSSPLRSLPLPSQSLVFAIVSFIAGLVDFFPAFPWKQRLMVYIRFLLLS